MNFVSIRIITADVNRLVSFYERITGGVAVWSNENFAELTIGTGKGATLAIASERTVALFAPGSAEPGVNRSVIIEFLVDDVDRFCVGVAAAAGEFVQEPTTMPWGNRSLLLRDPDGNQINMFTPVTDAAKAKFSR
jgi:predicted enzyme related to lactoylglutathione lyase